MFDVHPTYYIIYPLLLHLQVGKITFILITGHHFLVQIAGAPMSTALKFSVNQKYYFLPYPLKICLLPAVDCRNQTDNLINPTFNIIFIFSLG